MGVPGAGFFGTIEFIEFVGFIVFKKKILQICVYLRVSSVF